MTPERWRRLEDLYHAALAQAIERRAAFLVEACAGDNELQHEVESMLAQDTSRSGFFDRGAAGAAAQLVSTTATTMLTGRCIGVYEVLAPLGSGGMAEVYRARDTKLGREVAIKIMSAAFTSDRDRLARFEREARVLASLNHPHIAAIYGVEETDGIRALVLELVEGETLAERIARGSNPKGTGVPVKDALDIARQIADALDAAHERGIIHRDLKPANIKITPDGVVKVLDFGIAKLDARGADKAELSPTITIGGTSEGLIIGTAAYMSPEQARGLPIDKRTDIWAFGCVLYEMLTGSAAFARETLTDTIAAVVEREPNWSALPIMTPQGVHRLLRWCLEKDLRRRLRDATDVRVQVEDALNEPSVSAVPSPGSYRRARGWRAATAIALVAASIATASYLSRPRVDAPEIRLEITTPPTTDPVSLAVSPDGLKVAFTATTDGETRLWVRSLSSTQAQAFSGTDGASFPFWSPDGRSIGFFAQRQLKRIDLDSGAIRVLAPAEGGRGGAWADDGTILFQPTPGVGPLFRISAGGGKSSATKAEYGRFPQFLPDQRHFIYFRPGPPGIRGIYVGQLEGGNGQRLLETEAAATYAAAGYLLFVRQGTLFAQNFDVTAFTLKGEAFPVASGLAVNGPLLNAAVSTSAKGPFVYRAGSAGGLRQFVWFDRSGRTIGKVGDAIENPLQPEMSPDGRRLAMHRLVDANTDIWLLELSRGLLTRFTSSPTVESSPIWAPDGTHIVLASNQSGPGDLHLKTFTGEAREEVLLETPYEKWATDWSRDGQFLLYVERGVPPTGRDLWVLPMRDRKPFVVAQTEFDDEDGQFSPDVKWIAYQSNESGRMEVYLQPFGTPGRKVQVSTAGGAQARWRRDGNELYYVALDGKLMAVAIAVTASGVEVGNAVPLFPSHIGDPLQTNMRRAYVPSDDGQRFLVDTLTDAAVAPITVVLNWHPEPDK
jgi:eukaryotic-like serine/threonine-protein kinase